MQVRRIRIGTRRSKLALWQAQQILERLESVDPALEFKVEPLLTEGDARPEVPLDRMSGRGVFTNSLEMALRENRIDVAVHSFKDLPTESDPDLCLGAVPFRGDPRECLVSRAGELASLQEGAVVGTSSTRRAAQLRTLRPDLRFKPIRGNVDTRVRKVLEEGLYDATVLAAAGLLRLGLDAAVSQYFPLEMFLPAPAQGALAAQCRRNDSEVRALLASIDDRELRMAVAAERQFLEALGGGCAIPVAAYAEWLDGGSERDLHLTGTVLSMDGSRTITVKGRGRRGENLGRRVAAEAIRQGALGLVATRHPHPRPLAGRKIVVTRPLPQTTYLNERLRELGADPVSVPLIEISALGLDREAEALLAKIGEYDWIVFTSVNAVSIWSQLLAAAGVSWPAGPRLAAVGPQTAQELRNQGQNCSLTPEEFSKGHLVDALGPVQGKQILLPRGEAAGTALADVLRQQGAHVDEPVIYETLPLLPSRDQMRAVSAADAILFMSGSAVRSFAAALKRRGLGPELLEKVAIACIGPATARCAREAGLHVDAVADHYTVEGLVKSLVRFFGEKSDDTEA